MMLQLDAGVAQRAIALAVVIFLVQRVVSVAHAYLHTLASIGVCSGQQSGQHRPYCCCSVCGYLERILLQARFAFNIYRRSKALAALPGPSYGLLGIVDSLRRRKVHRNATEWCGPGLSFVDTRGHESNY